MDLLETLNSELSNKRLTDLEKIRYIYLRCCQFFSFDSRWYYNYLWNHYKLNKDIEKRKIDLHNINDFRVICFSISHQVLKPLIEELTFTSPYVSDNGSHASVYVKCNNNLLNLDPVYGDFTKVKVGAKTLDFTGLSPDYDLSEIDRELGFDLEDITKLSNIDEYADPEDTLQKLAFFINKNNFTQYDDPSYLIRKFGPEDYTFNKTFVSKKYDFHKFIELIGTDIIYELYKDKDFYKMDLTSHEKLDKISRNVRYRK